MGRVNLLATLVSQPQIKQLLVDVTPSLKGHTVETPAQDWRCSHLVVDLETLPSHEPLVVHASVRGVPVVTSEWVHSSVEKGVWADVEEFLVFDQRKREKMQGSRQLLKGLKVRCENSDVESQVGELIKLTGGKLVKGKFDTENIDFILGQSVGCIPVERFVNCILTGNTKILLKAPKKENLSSGKVAKKNEIVKQAVTSSAQSVKKTKKKLEEKKGSSCTVLKSTSLATSAEVEAAATLGELSHRRPVIAVSGLRSEGFQLATDIVNSLEKVCPATIVADMFAESATHIIVPSNEPTRTLKVMNGIIRGAWIVSVDWLHESLNKQLWCEPLPFEMNIAFPGARKMRERKEKGECGFLSGVSFYVSRKTRAVKKSVEHLIRNAGGNLATESTADFIILGLDEASKRKKAGVTNFRQETWLYDIFKNGDTSILTQQSESTSVVKSGSSKRKVTKPPTSKKRTLSTNIELLSQKVPSNKKKVPRRQVSPNKASTSISSSESEDENEICGSPVI